MKKKKPSEKIQSKSKTCTISTSIPAIGKITANLGNETFFKGHLTYEGTVKIDAKVEGEIIAKDTLIIGEKAEINADIKVGRLISYGKIIGNIIASDRADFFAPATISGSIESPVISLDDGVVFEGECKIGIVGVSDQINEFLEIKEGT